MCELCHGLISGCPNCDTATDDDFDDLLDLADEMNIIEQEAEDATP